MNLEEWLSRWAAWDAWVAAREDGNLRLDVESDKNGG